MINNEQNEVVIAHHAINMILNNEWELCEEFLNKKK